MDEKRSILAISLALLAVIALAVGVYLLFFRVKPVEDLKSGTTPAKAGTVGTETAGAIPVFPPTPLNDSDDLIRKLTKELSSDPRLDSWLQTKDIIRKFAAAVDAIAEGRSPEKQIDFFVPQGKFQVLKKGGREIINPVSYERYNPAAEAFVSFNARDCVRFYRGLKNLIQEAYRELGYPDRDFDLTLRRALIELLETPVVEGDILVERKVKTYVFADPKLEGLSEAQKHFLRLGPLNVSAIQLKLREMALALGVPAEDLPRRPFR
ncbi:MAG: DUF3014 domain-containing protein [Candidatus Aminicenantales bacterium]